MTVPHLPADGVKAHPRTPTTNSTQLTLERPTGARLSYEPKPRT